MVWEVPSRFVFLCFLFFFQTKQNQVNYLTLSTFSSMNENVMGNIGKNQKWLKLCILSLLEDVNLFL